MAKGIMITSLRNGLGRTVTACLLGMRLSEIGKKTLILDNNYRFNDVERYLLVEPKYTIDDVKPYLISKSLNKDILKSLCTTIDENLHILAGSRFDNVTNMLTAKEIKNIIDNSADLFDYVIIDNRAGLVHKENIEMLEFIDHSVVLAQPNTNAKHDLKEQLSRVPKEDMAKITGLYEKSIVILNRFTDDLEYDMGHLKKAFGKDNVFTLYYSTSIIDFCNGLRINLDPKNQSELDGIILSFTQEQSIEDKKGTSKLVGKLRSLTARLNL